MINDNDDAAACDDDYESWMMKDDEDDEETVFWTYWFPDGDLAWSTVGICHMLVFQQSICQYNY